MPLGGDRPNDTRFIPAKKKPPKKKVPKKAVRPDDRDVHLGREPAPEKSSPQAQAWSAPRTIFLPPALTKKTPKPKPKPEPRYDPGATKLSPKPTAAQQRRAELQGLVQSATERRKASLGLTDKKQEPTVTDAVATRQEMASAKKADDLRFDLQRTPPNMVGNAKKIRDYQTKLVHEAEGLTARDRLTLIDEVNQAYTDRTTPGAGLTPQMAKDAAVGLGRSVVHAGQGLKELPGNLIGQAMNPTVNRSSPLPPGVQRAARVTGQLPGAKPFTDVMMTSAKRNEEVAEGIFGKSLVNLVGHGDAPGSVAEAGGLVFGVVTIGPVGKVGRGAAAGAAALAKVLKAERDIAAAVEAGRTAATVAYHGPSIRQRTITAVRLKRAQAIQQQEIATLQSKVPDMIQGVNWANKEIVKIEDQLPGMTVAEKTKAVRQIEILTDYREVQKAGIAKAAEHPVSTGKIKYAVRTPYNEEHAATIKTLNEAVDVQAEATVNFKPYKEWKAEKFEGNAEAQAARDAKNAADARLQAARNDELFYRVEYEINPQVIDTPERRALAESLVAKYSGQKNALPPRVQDVDSVLRAMDMADQLATRGRAGRFWYEKSAKEIMRIARGSKAKAVRIAQLLAIYSPQQPILGNTSLAVRAMAEHAGTGKVTTGQGWQQDAAQGVLDGGDDYLEKQARAWKGRKTNNFAFNFIEEINKRLFKKLGLEGNEVTSDLWMARVFGYLTDTVSDGRYDFIEGVVRQIAKERGWKAKQVQAAIWTAIKDASDDVTANISFAEGISRMFGQINFEAIPGLAVSPELHAEYLKLSPEAKRMFLAEKSALVDQFLDDLGLAGLASQEGPGVYINNAGDLELNLGAQATLPMSLAPADTYRLPEAERATYDFASAAIGRALKQDSVAWVRPFVPRAMSHANAAVVRLGRRMTPEEASDLAQALPDLGIIHMGNDGFMVRSFGGRRFFSDISPSDREKLEARFIELYGEEAAQGKAGKKAVAKWAEDPDNADPLALNPRDQTLSAKDFQTAVDDAVDLHFNDEGTEVVYHASDGELVESSSYSALAKDVGDGEGSASHLRATSAADRLASDSHAIDQRYFSRRARAGRYVRSDRAELGLPNPWGKRDPPGFASLKEAMDKATDPAVRSVLRSSLYNIKRGTGSGVPRNLDSLLRRLDVDPEIAALIRKAQDEINAEPTAGAQVPKAPNQLPDWLGGAPDEYPEEWGRQDLGYPERPPLAPEGADDPEGSSLEWLRDALDPDAWKQGRFERATPEGSFDDLPDLVKPENAEDIRKFVAQINELLTGSGRLNDVINSGPLAAISLLKSAAGSGQWAELEPILWRKIKEIEESMKTPDSLEGFASEFMGDVRKGAQDKASRVKGMGHLYGQGDVVEGNSGRIFEILHRTETTGKRYDKETKKFIPEPRKPAYRVRQIGGDNPGHEFDLAEDALKHVPDEPPDWLGKLMDEDGNIIFDNFFADPNKIRTMRYNDLITQMQGSRSQFTRRVIEGPADRFSRWLLDEGRTQNGLNRLMPWASAERRVSKQAGRNVTREGERARARMKRFVDALPKAGSPEDIAHFWWAQLPEAYRNLDGLRLISDKQKEELRYALDPDGAQVDLRDDIIDAIEERKRVEWNSDEYWALQNEIGGLRHKLDDLPLMIDNLRAQIAQLDTVIARGPELDPKIMRGVEGLSLERERILIGSGALESEVAVKRHAILSDWLALPSDGTEIYVGHRMGRVQGARPDATPAGVALGRPKTPQGVGSRNRLLLASSGRVRPTTHVAAEDWSASQIWLEAGRVREDLGKLGKPFGGRLEADEYLVNPTGKLVPPSWKGGDPLAALADGGYEENAVKKFADDLAGAFLFDGGLLPRQTPGETDVEYGRRVANAIREFAGEGSSFNKLRVVKKSTADRYGAQFKTAGKGNIYDSVVDLAVTSVVFARIGYIPKNIAANLLLSVPHQGVYWFANAPRAAALLRHKELLDLINGEMGQGAAAALGREATKVGSREVTQKVAGFVSAGADMLPRASAFIHEAAASGVIPKLNPTLDDQTVIALMDLLTNKNKRWQLNDIRSRANEAMVDFSRLTPQQRRNARRFVIIPSWLWSGSRYPFHFMATHPGRSAAILYLAAGAPGAEPLEGLPDYRSIPGEGFKKGIETRFGRLRTNPVDPASTPLGLGVAAYNTLGAGIVRDPVSPFSTEDTLWSSASIPLGIGQGIFAGEGLLPSLRRAVPSGTFLKDMIMGANESAYYPEDTSRWGRFKRETGVLPIKVNDVAGKKTGPADSWVADLKAGKMTPFTVVEKMLDRRRRSLVGKGELEKAQAMGLVINDVQGSLSFNDYKTLGVDEINKIINETNVTRRALKLKEVPAVTQEEYDEVKKEAQEAIETVEKIRSG